MTILKVCKRTAGVLLLAGLFFLVTSCSSTPPEQNMSSATASAMLQAAEDNASPTGTNQVDVPSDYKIAPQDVLAINVFNEPDLTQEAKVSNSGSITFPLLGNVPVAGLTCDQVQKLLTNLLSQNYLVNPQVTVAVKQYRMRIVSVLGAVNKPGAIMLPGEQRWSILDAISQAGGPTDQAGNKIEFTRMGHTEDFSFSELKNITDPNKIIWLQPGDIINIPESVF